MTVAYQQDNVLVAARKRVARLFDDFDRVVVSVSAGKDSTVIRHLCLREAARRSRRIALFFLDQEAEYQSTVDLMTAWMSDPAIDRLWYQVPLRLTNATSHRQYWLHSWEPGALWVHPQSPWAIHAISAAYPDRFYPFFEWFEGQATQRTACVVGLRSKESFNRFRAVTKKPGYAGLCWTTATANPLAVRAYPIYDWTFGDVWKYIVDHQLRYNAHYDRMFAKHGINISRMRVSNLIHEKSFRCLQDLQEFEPDTYERMVARLAGVHAAALYAGERYVYNAKALPACFSSWRDYRDYLLVSTPIDQRVRFQGRFSKQQADEETCRQQCKQILINDWENSVPVSAPRRSKIPAIWWDRL